MQNYSTHQYKYDTDDLPPPSRSLKTKQPNTAAIPPESVLITVTTETEPLIAPQEKAENPPKLSKLAIANQPIFFGDGNLRPASNLITTKNKTNSPTA